MCIVLDTTITVVAVPVLMRELDASLATMQWTTTAYILALVTTLPLAARLSTRYGPRRTYVAAMLVFALGSVLAGLASGPVTLIAARVVQGLGGGLVNPVAMMLLMRGVPAAQRGKVASLLGLPVLLGPLTGPVLSGWLIDTWSWRAIFFITVPPALLAAVLVRRLAPPDGAGTREPVDVRGLALLLPASVITVLGLGEAALPAALRLALIAAGLGLMLGFVRHARTTSAPLLRVALLWRRSMASSVVVLVLFGAAYFGSMLLLPTYVQVMRGDSALTAGSMSIPVALATGLMMQVATRLVDRVEPWRIVAAGLTVSLAGAVTLAVVLRPDTSYVVLMAASAVIGLGAGAVILPAMTAATRDLDGADLASGSSVMGLAQQLASAFGTAAVTALLAAAVAWRAPLLDDGLEGAARLSGPARADVAPDLVDAQRLTQLAVVLLIGTALVLALTLMPRASRPPKSQPQEDR
ncbi:hypothetical protein VV01_17855 [Luteipulveratus halotolerans]|uniref:Major facilitator superfamily (MFS) profile domain-containing protein n=1 Tax=Luteipulveratus halotolerans TaxID=1631356 RepID=A0A0L6CP89_9MICO|nr:hypothetical protein VV01_17855 [Luteipulveratus halotolerans]